MSVEKKKRSNAKSVPCKRPSMPRKRKVLTFHNVTRFLGVSRGMFSWQSTFIFTAWATKSETCLIFGGKEPPCVYPLLILHSVPSNQDVLSMLTLMPAMVFYHKCRREDVQSLGDSCFLWCWKTPLKINPLTLVGPQASELWCRRAFIEWSICLLWLTPSISRIHWSPTFGGSMQIRVGISDHWRREEPWREDIHCISLYSQCRLHL